MTRKATDGGQRPLTWPDDPETVTAADIDFEALAHVLANTCRRGGCMLDRAGPLHLAERCVDCNELVSRNDAGEQDGHGLTVLSAGVGKCQQRSATNQVCAL